MKFQFWGYFILLLGLTLPLNTTTHYEIWAYGRIKYTVTSDHIQGSLLVSHPFHPTVTHRYSQFVISV
jgi:hypothetical protein